MIKRSIWWDDTQYLIEELHGDFAVTEVSEDGHGSDVSASRAAAVIEAACDADDRRRSA